MEQVGVLPGKCEQATVQQWKRRPLTSGAWSKEGVLLESQGWTIQVDSSMPRAHFVSERKLGFLNPAMKCEHKESNHSIQDMTCLRDQELKLGWSALR